MFPKSKRFIEPASCAPAVGSYNVTNSKKKGEAVHFSKSKRFADHLKDKLLGPCDTSSYLDSSTCSTSSWAGNTMSSPRTKYSYKLERNRLEMTVAALEKEIKYLKAHNSLLQNKEITTDVSKVDKAVATEEEGYYLTSELDTRTKFLPATEVEEKAVGTDGDPCVDIAAILATKEKELADLQLMLRCDQENTKADLELEKSLNSALKMRITSLEKNQQELSLDRDQVDEENQKLHDVAAGLRTDNLQLREKLNENEQHLQETKGKLEEVVAEGEQKITALQVVVSEEVTRGETQKTKLAECLEKCNANFAEAQSTANNLRTRNSELEEKVDDLEDKLVEIFLREQKADESVRCLQAENCSLNSRLKQGHEDYEQRLEMAGEQVEILQSENKRNDKMMTDNLRSLTAKFEALEESYANERLNNENERQTIIATLEVTKKSLQDSNEHGAELEFTCISLKEQMFDDQQVASKKQESSACRVRMLESELEQVQKAAQETQANVEDQISEVQKTIAALETSEKQFVDELEKSASIHRQQEKELAHLRDEVDRLKRDKEHSVIQLEAEVERYRKETISLKENAKETEETLSSIHRQQEKELAHLRDEVDRLKRDKEHSVIQLEAEVERYRKETISLKENAKETEETLSRKASQAEEKTLKIKAEFGRRLVETQKKLTQTEMNFTMCKRLHDEQLEHLEDDCKRRLIEADEENAALREQYNRRLVETQKKLTETEINFTRFKEEQTLSNKKNEEELVRCKQLHDEQLEQLEVDCKRRLIEADEENAALREQFNRQSYDVAAAAELKAQLEMWQAKYQELQEKVEPFREQLDAFEAEKKALLCQNNESQNEVAKLGTQYAKLLGHQNQKQKIHHVLKLKQENISLKSENAMLREQCEKHKRSLKRLEEKVDNVSGKRRFNPADAFSHAKKENRPLSLISNGNVSFK